MSGLVKCDACRMLVYRVRRVGVTVDGAVVSDVTLCQRCQSDAVDAFLRALRDRAAA